MNTSEYAKQDAEQLALRISKLLELQNTILGRCRPVVGIIASELYTQDGGDCPLYMLDKQDWDIIGHYESRAKKILRSINLPY